VSETKTFTEQEAHKYFGVQLNNKVWELLGKENRSEQENETMIHAAHTSYYHWSLIGTVFNLGRGEWMISHVYAVLNQPEPALHYAQRCLQICLDNQIGDFDLAYAYEAMARALAAKGDLAEAGKYLSLAKEAGEQIKNDEDKRIFVGDFETGPWYGLK
jgi:tetratricopeptide (TPR) repeat protein